GIRLSENFRQPFFSKTISEFWQRWHITLGKWFKDYVFYPISMSKSMKRLTIRFRKKIGNHYGPLVSGSIALFAVWICNGLWHGSGWNYIFFGLYHFLFILGGSLVEPLMKKIRNHFHINKENRLIQFIQICKTTIIVIIGELFFRAHGLKAGISMFQMIVTKFTFQSIINGEILSLGMDIKDYLIIGLAILIVLLISILQEKGIDIRDVISKQNTFIRWSLYYSFIFFIVIFGAYGYGYVPIDPIYANF
ncbi:MAG: MBOAT family protein, partial [Traorella sp.]